MRSRLSGQSAGMVLAMSLGLGACATTDLNELVEACPSAQVAFPSDSIGHSDEEGRIRYVATIEKLVSNCQIDGDQVTLDLAFDLKAERGPAFVDEPIKLTYYLATVGPEREIIDKKLLNVELALKGEQANLAVREELTLELPASKDVTGSNYNLYLGFQPDEKQEG